MKNRRVFEKALSNRGTNLRSMRSQAHGSPKGGIHESADGVVQAKLQANLQTHPVKAPAQKKEQPPRDGGWRS